MDFADIAELAAGETISTAAVNVSAPLLAYDVLVAGNRVTATLFSGIVETAFAVPYTIETSGGAILQRVGIIKVVA
jgi:hypothetical protein